MVAPPPHHLFPPNYHFQYPLYYSSRGDVSDSSLFTVCSKCRSISNSWFLNNSLLSWSILLISKSQRSLLTYYCLLWLLLLISCTRVAKVTAVIIGQIRTGWHLLNLCTRFLLLYWSTHLIWIVHEVLARVWIWTL